MMSETETTIAEAVRGAAEALRRAGVAEARREAGSLVGFAAGRDRTFLLTHADAHLAPDELARLRAAVARRAAGEPLQYITGRQEFYGLEFEVNSDVLIPRPETELLVESALEVFKDAPVPTFCDVGTGSGCVAVALLHARPRARACALDLSPAALAVAARNAARHGVGERLTLLVSDCFGALRDAAHGRAGFDAVVSNPPYVAERDLPGLQREVRDHEPRGALTPGGDGLSVIRRLVAEAPQFLRPGGHLLFEIGHDQHERVRRLVDPRVWTLLDIRRDLQGIPRTVSLRLA
jgi:release factor glutamine methyltransferase